jgi:hypothetical protein
LSIHARSRVVSSFTIVKGSLIEETYSIFRDWNYRVSKFENLRHVREENSIGATSTNWALNATKVMNRRFDPEGRDRPLVELAKADCDREVWKPLLLYHMTRDEFLVRDFLINCLFPQFRTGAYRLRSSCPPHRQPTSPGSSTDARLETQSTTTGRRFFRVRGSGCGIAGWHS